MNTWTQMYYDLVIRAASGETHTVTFTDLDRAMAAKRTYSIGEPLGFGRSVITSIEIHTSELEY